MADIDKLVEQYIVLRDNLASVKKSHKAAMDNISTKILELCDEQNVSSFKTTHGTATKTTTEYFTVTNWGAALDFIIANDLTFMLPQSIKKASLVEYREENGSLPAGVQPGKKVKLNVLRRRK